MTRVEPGPDATMDIDLRIKHKCFTCGNSRAFYVAVDRVARLWEVTQPMPEGGRVVACGRCRSRNSVIFDYSD